VAYEYQIGKYHVTIGQYTAFLNAVAVTDTYSLYNANMATNLNVAGIAQAGVSGSFTYSVITNGGISVNRPITYVSWWDAARFSNWMANGQPTGAQSSTTTENGAYNVNGATSGTVPAKNATNPNTGAAPTRATRATRATFRGRLLRTRLRGLSFAFQLLIPLHILWID
jgi:formylglycine-generating enzyme required for sulfatase activity